ncbi:MAG: primosomal protein N' [Candidatus Peregrinibacteria bacterium]
MLYANVVLCRKAGEFDSPLSYEVPVALENSLKVGHFVRMPFRSQVAQGIVVALFSDLPAGMESSKIKSLQEVLPEPAFTPAQIQFAVSLTHYYHASLTKVLGMMTPKAIWEGRFKIPEAKIIHPISAEIPERILTSGQTDALRQIEQSKKPVLLHGVTGSGKTELYLRMILKTSAEGKQALLLIPEIALTPQTVDYFKAYLGDAIEVFHSRLTEKQRIAGWWRVRRGEVRLVIGSRSAIFAPFLDLGLIVIDEEHEWTYKQESAPYYETHWAAEKLRELYGAKLLLGSATPRLESYAKTRTGEYELVMLPERIHQPNLPKITVVDLREEFQKKNFGVFSLLLQRKMAERLQNREQIILFVNQRGVARAVVCRDCGHREQCPRCDISLKYHRGVRRELQDRLMCHYCGFLKAPPVVCPSCQSSYIKHIGIGTERVEEEVKKLFSAARTIRADRDTTSGKAGFEPIYKAFLAHEYDVLVGTQMVAKGLDFERVSLIGIVLADIGMGIPDFRSHERLFQLITQVAGRCGRSLAQPGEVVLQTYQPDHPAVLQAAAYGYKTFADEELRHRQKFGYPPYGRLIKFTVVGSDEQKLHHHIQAEEGTLNDIFTVNHLPLKVMSAPALVSKVKDRYYYHVLVQGQEPQKLFDHWKVPKGWRADVDPVHTT